MLLGADFAEVVKSHKPVVSPAKPLQNNRHPAGNEPGGKQAFRVHVNRCAVEALLTHLPVLKRQKQGPDHRTDCILKVRDQLNRQEGKSPSPFIAHKASYGDLILLELGEKLNGIPPIGGDLSIAIRTIADGAKGSNGGRKINLTGQKRFAVFPKGLEFVKVGELNFSAPCSQGGRLWAAQTGGLPPCRAWLFFRGQFLTSLIRPPLYHRLYLHANSTIHSESSIGVDNIGTRSLGAIMGLLTAGFAFGAAVGPAVGGYIFDVSGHYFMAFATGAIAMLVAACLIAFVRK